MPTVTRAADAAEIAGRVRFLGDTTRLLILRALGPEEVCVGELCERLGFAQPAMSNHLALLRLRGLVSSRREGKFNFYGLTAGGRAALEAVDRIASISRDDA